MPDVDQSPGPTSGVVDEDTGEAVTPQAVVTWDQVARNGAVTAAGAAMRAFARPRLKYDVWWTQLQPLLTPRAAQDYAYVDPADVPAKTVTGPGRLVDQTSAYVARVSVPTDVGPYTVIVSRSARAAPWLASRITPPSGH